MHNRYADITLFPRNGAEFVAHHTAIANDCLYDNRNRERKECLKGVRRVTGIDYADVRSDEQQAGSHRSHR